MKAPATTAAQPRAKRRLLTRAARRLLPLAIPVASGALSGLSLPPIGWWPMGVLGYGGLAWALPGSGPANGQAAGASAAAAAPGTAAAPAAPAVPTK